ncbi:hypothetical protein HSEST_0205 [Halapricum desulfuricans]|uniref:Uncharacterized protein n=1 Tax=Halapricum desulfuricans TaxID=2841257 RepID=A0A897NM39_9EURY|nr:hypothetical protein HSEST_0205 [Halapricum desulfuricans]
MDHADRLGIRHCSNVVCSLVSKFVSRSPRFGSVPRRVRPKHDDGSQTEPQWR